MNAGHLIYLLPKQNKNFIPPHICYLIIHTKIPIIHHQDIKNVKHFSFKLSKKLHWFDKSLLKIQTKVIKTNFSVFLIGYLGFNHLLMQVANILHFLLKN